jgi:ABC-2 type transport system ATP-binding protein
VAGMSSPTFSLPPHLLAALVPLLVLLVALDAYCLIDLARARSMGTGAKVIWTMVIVFVSAPLGALLYLLLGRGRGLGRQDSQATAGAQEAAGHGQPDVGEHGNARPAGARQAPGDRPAMVTTSGLTRDYAALPAGRTRRADHGTVTMGIGRGQVAVCPDVPEFDGWLTAYEVVDLTMSLVAPAVDGHAVRTALTTAGLADSADRRVGGFSRGMLQRLGLACALVGDPESTATSSRAGWSGSPVTPRRWPPPWPPSSGRPGSSRLEPT